MFLEHKTKQLILILCVCGSFGCLFGGFFLGGGGGGWKKGGGWWYANNKYYTFLSVVSFLVLLRPIYNGISWCLLMQDFTYLCNLPEIQG